MIRLNARGGQWRSNFHIPEQQFKPMYRIVELINRDQHPCCRTCDLAFDAYRSIRQSIVGSANALPTEAEWEKAAR